jgi:hypothetical protein
MFILGTEIGSFDYDFCENIDLSFIKNYEPKFEKYLTSLNDYTDYDFAEMEDYDDINNGENFDIYYKLSHFIDTYFDTPLSFYTEVITENLYHNEPLYLGITTESKNIKHIKELKKNYDMVSYNDILNLLDIDNNEISIYKVNCYN